MDSERSRADFLRARLFERRVVSVDGVLDDELAARVAAELMTLDAAGDERIQMLLNCAGGTLGGAFTVMDVIDLLGVPVHVTCVGRAEGPAIGVLAVGAWRTAVAHARLRLGAPEGEFHGRAADVVRWAEEQHHQIDRFCERLAAASRCPAAWLADAVRNGLALEVGEAIRRGLVDEVARSNAASVHRIDGARIGFQPRSRPTG
jgi:ATP-dependent Clp protease protease subunit